MVARQVLNLLVSDRNRDGVPLGYGVVAAQEPISQQSSLTVKQQSPKLQDECSNHSAAALRRFLIALSETPSCFATFERLDWLTI